MIDNPIEMNDLGVPQFWETTILGNCSISSDWIQRHREDVQKFSSQATMMVLQYGLQCFKAQKRKWGIYSKYHGDTEVLIIDFTVDHQ